VVKQTAVITDQLAAKRRDEVSLGGVSPRSSGK
jgi:hypothetical protein